MTDLSDKTAEIKLLEPEQTALKPKSIKQDRAVCNIKSHSLHFDYCKSCMSVCQLTQQLLTKNKNRVRFPKKKNYQHKNLANLA